MTTASSAPAALIRRWSCGTSLRARSHANSEVTPGSVLLLATLWHDEELCMFLLLLLLLLIFSCDSTLLFVLTFNFFYASFIFSSHRKSTVSSSTRRQLSSCLVRLHSCKMPFNVHYSVFIVCYNVRVDLNLAVCVFSSFRLHRWDRSVLGHQVQKIWTHPGSRRGSGRDQQPEGRTTWAAHRVSQQSRHFLSWNLRDLQVGVDLAIILITNESIVFIITHSDCSSLDLDGTE